VQRLSLNLGGNTDKIIRPKLIKISAWGFFYFKNKGENENEGK
jgi:hypothetical protein